MSDPNVVDPNNSTYSLNKPDDAKVGEVPQASLDKVLPRQVSTGLSRGIQQLGTQNVYVDSGNNQIIVGDTVGQNILPRVLMGNQTTFGDGFYVSKEGVDVTTNTDTNNFIFNSNQNVFKIVKTGTVTVQANATAGVPIETVVRHDLGYVPIPLVYLTDTTTSIIYPLPAATAMSVSLGNVGFNNWSEATATAEVLDIVFTSGTTANWGTLIYKYYLLQESAS